MFEKCKCLESVVAATCSRQKPKFNSIKFTKIIHNYILPRIRLIKIIRPKRLFDLNILRQLEGFLVSSFFN